MSIEKASAVLGLFSPMVGTILNILPTPSQFGTTAILSAFGAIVGFTTGLLIKYLYKRFIK